MTAGAGAPGPRSARLLALVLAAGAGLRLAHWLAVRRLPFVDALVLDSAEYARWARAIAAGDWLGREPFFQAPLYPYLIALVYRGVASPHAVYLLQIAAAVAGLWALHRAGREMADEATGLAAAFLGAVYAPFVFHDVQLLKESLATTAVAFLLWALAGARRRGNAASWLVAGALLGLLALLRENALLLAPVLALLAFSRGDVPRVARRVGAFAAGLVLVLVPVAARNAALGGGFLPTTYQGGVNLYIGNNPSADGRYRPLVPGRQVPEMERREPWRLAEAALGRRLAASEVSSYWLHRSLDWARSRPVDFARLTLRKLALYWSPREWPDAVDYAWVRQRSPLLAAVGLELPGLALAAAVGLAVAWRRRLLGRLAPAWLFGLAWMVSTVAFFLFSRYRLPGLPPLCLLGGVALGALFRGERRDQAPAADAGGRVPRALAALLLVAAWGVSRLAAGEPDLELVHTNLGRLAAQRGDAVAAEREFRAALAANPRSAGVLLELGTLAGRAGRTAEALAFFDRSVRIEPASPEAWANLGAARLAARDLPGAREALERAVTLDATLVPALVNRVLVELAAGDLAAAEAWHGRLAAAAPGHPAVASLAARLAAARGVPPR